MIGRCGQPHQPMREMEQYFKPVPRPLPNPHGDLAKLVPRSEQARGGGYVTWPTILFPFVTAAAYGSWTFPGSRRQSTGLCRNGSLEHNSQMLAYTSFSSHVNVLIIYGLNERKSILYLERKSNRTGKNPQYGSRIGLH